MTVPPTSWRSPAAVPAAAAARRRLCLLVLAATSVLAFSGAHALSLRLADPHTHLHEHGLEHSGISRGQQQLVEFHSWQTPTALTALVVLLAALIALRFLPGRALTPALTGRLLSLVAAGSAVAFGLVETAEHALSAHATPPVALLVIGGLVHAAAGASAVGLSRTVLRLTCLPPQPQPRSRPAVRRRAAISPTPRRLHPQALLAVLAGRAPPRTTAVPQLSV